MSSCSFSEELLCLEFRRRDRPFEEHEAGVPRFQVERPFNTGRFQLSVDELSGWHGKRESLPADPQERAGDHDLAAGFEGQHRVHLYLITLKR